MVDSTEQILSGLNKEQRSAVSAPLSPALVLAGAGSGKTRVLVHRIAWLSNIEKVSCNAIIAVTFTNKAANEMRSRIESLTSLPVRGMWIGTFHGLCTRFLRLHHERAGLESSFQILDSQDQLRLVRRVTTRLNLDEEKYPPKQTQWFINQLKEAGKRADAVQEEGEPNHDQMLGIYREYERTCRSLGIVDFTELLLATHELLRDNAELLQHYQARFKHILVDEFQDTNQLQYAWLRVLAGTKIPIFAVGDDDQSIYGWRGACTENINYFKKDFANLNIFRLERNYRSTETILNAANALIEHNQHRMSKRLWTEDKQGTPIQLFAAFNEREEAEFVVLCLQEWQEQKRALKEAAVLYRANAQSRIIESALAAAKIPYRVYGGLRFFERAVIKNALAYLRLMNHPLDDPSFERIVNYPTRGIGQRTLTEIREYARNAECSLWSAGTQLIKSEALNRRACAALQAFFELISELASRSKALPLDKQVEQVVALLIKHLEKKPTEAAQSDIENLEELVVAAQQFSKQWLQENEEDVSELDGFLAYAALEAGDEEAQSDEDYVQLMTLHSAKGLEFPMVIITGLEEGLCPHERSLGTQNDLEEERRLCYVGITRAEERLVLCHAEARNRGYSSSVYHARSRFIDELPAELIEAVRPTTHLESTAHTATASAYRSRNGEWVRLGQRVLHPTFGEGVVIDLEGVAEYARVQVRFSSAGTKWLVLSVAKLTALDTP